MPTHLIWTLLAGLFGLTYLLARLHNLTVIRWGGTQAQRDELWTWLACFGVSALAAVISYILNPHQ